MYALHCKNSKDILRAEETGYKVEYVGRPTPWGNPFTHLPLKGTRAIFYVSSREESIAKYREWLTSPEQADLLAEAKLRLKGKVLTCWCKPKACHADVLIELVNEG